MKIAFRMDDITPDMDWKSFEAFEQLFERYGCYPLLGIVPDNLDPKLSVDPAREAFWKKMQELQKKGWTLSMHGCHHVYTTKRGGSFPLNAQSEFAGKSYEEQYQLLESGQKKLLDRGIETKLFMAPGHTFDKTTLRALKALGFTHVTDGFGDLPYVRSGMTFLPIAFLRKYAFSDREGMTTIVIHANHSTVAELKAYEEMIDANRENIVPYSDLFKLEAKPQCMTAWVQPEGALVLPVPSAVSFPGTIKSFQLFRLFLCVKSGFADFRHAVKPLFLPFQKRKGCLCPALCRIL